MIVPTTVAELLADIAQRANALREARNSRRHNLAERKSLYIAEMALRRILEDYS